MNIVYIGSPDFSANLLRTVANKKDELQINVSHVITQPDQPVGRKKILTPTPVHITGKELGIPVHFDIEILKEIRPDLVLLFAYGRIIPQWALDIPHFGFWNVHPSLLPFYRGASPLSYPLLLDEKKTGTTIMQMDAELDHGEIIYQEEMLIEPTDTQITLQNKLTELSSKILIQGLQNITSTRTLPIKTPQDHNSATYTRPFEKNDGYIPFPVINAAMNNRDINYEEFPEIYKDWYARNSITPPRKIPALSIVKNMYRALTGWPGIWTKIALQGQEKRLVLHSIDLSNDNLKIQSVQLEGKTQIDFSTFNRAYSIL